MLGIISAILGFLTSTLPNIISYFEQRQRYQYEIEITKLKLSVAEKGFDMAKVLADSKWVVQEGDSIRHHDSTISTNEYINDLRASVRPVLTYLFFFVFLLIKVSTLTLMLGDNVDPYRVIAVFWDDYTSSIFGAICGFWFGSRAMVYMNETFNSKGRSK